MNYVVPPGTPKLWKRCIPLPEPIHGMATAAWQLRVASVLGVAGGFGSATTSKSGHNARANHAKRIDPPLRDRNKLSTSIMSGHTIFFLTAWQMDDPSRP